MDWIVPGAARGMFVDLTPYVERDGVDLSAYWYPHDLEWVWEGGLYGGLLYAGGQALYVNKDLLDAAGVAFPADDWTWDDLRAAALDLTNADENQFGVHFYLVTRPTGGHPSSTAPAGRSSTRPSTLARWPRRKPSAASS